MTGFLQLVPLAVGALDLVGLIIGLSLLLVMWAGWVFLALVGKVTSRIPWFGQPLSRALDLISGLWKRGTMNVINGAAHYIEHVAKMAWSVMQVCWRFMYVTNAVIFTLVRHQAAAQQDYNTRINNLQAREDFFIGQLRAQEEQAIAALGQNVLSIEAQLQQQIADSSTAVENDVAAARTAESVDVHSLQANINRVYDTLEQTLQSDLLNLNNRITSVQTVLQQAESTDVHSLQANINAGVSTSENFTVGYVAGVVPDLIRQLAPNPQPQIDQIKTEMDRCVEPLCDPAGQVPKKLRQTGDLFNHMAALEIAGVFIALAETALHDPRFVHDDLSSMVHAVGDPLAAGIKGLIEG
jgi:hypothetical protein